VLCRRSSQARRELVQRSSNTRDLRRRDQSVTPPPALEQPAARARDSRRTSAWTWVARARPAGEPTRRRGRIENRLKRNPSSHLRKMSARIEQDISQHVPHLSRRSQNVAVEAVCKHGSAKPEDTVHGSREPRTDGLHSACEIAVACRFDDQMHVIGLDRVMNDSETSALARSRQVALPFSYEPPRAQRGESSSHLQRHLAWVARRERRPCAMRIARMRPAPARRPPQRAFSRRPRSS